MNALVIKQKSLFENYNLANKIHYKLNNWNFLTHLKWYRNILSLCYLYYHIISMYKEKYQHHNYWYIIYHFVIFRWSIWFIWLDIKFDIRKVCVIWQCLHDLTCIIIDFKVVVTSLCVMSNYRQPSLASIYLLYAVQAQILPHTKGTVPDQ